MNTIDLTGHVFPKDRDKLRKDLIGIFLNEKPGINRYELASRNRYLIKRIADKVIYLQRPAQFNNGFDFTLNVSDINFNIGYYNDKGKQKRSTTRPSHEHILDDLLTKKNSNALLYSDFLLEIERVYNCEDPKKVKFDFNVGYNSEMILECIKWLFIEQDVTYWHYSGRSMFYEAITNL